jgi:hypothetical protein
MWHRYPQANWASHVQPLETLFFFGGHMVFVLVGKQLGTICKYLGVAMFQFHFTPDDVM